MKSAHHSSQNSFANPSNKKPEAIGGSALAGQVADPSLKRSFKGHKDGVTSSCFNPNLR